MDRAATKSPQPSLQLSSDSAIRSRAEDRLGRAPFAEKLAAAIASWGGTESLVIGLCGPWGTGKSSIKNMALDALALENSPPTVVEFAPWQWSSQNQVFKAFFRVIAEQLGTLDEGNKLRRIADKLRLLGSALRIADVLRARDSALLASLGLLLGLVGLSTDTPWVRASLTILAVTMTLLSVLVTLLDRVAAFVERWAGLGTPSMESVRRDIRGALQNIRPGLLIIIDDIDRLPPKDIACVFQLVKANADFPNVVYLLVFEREHVATGLRAFYKTKAADTLIDKVVHLQLDVPVVEQSQINEVLDSCIEHAVGLRAPEPYKGRSHWDEVYHSGIRGLFDTLRAVYRFSNRLQVLRDLHKSGGRYEVNEADLVALEVMRYHIPHVHEWVLQNFAVVTGRPGPMSRDREKKERVRTALEKVLQDTVEGSRPVVREILRVVFPPIRTVTDNEEFGDASVAEWATEKRACHPDYFGRYFVLGIPVADVPDSDVAGLLRRGGDTRWVETQLVGYARRGVLEKVLQKAVRERRELAAGHVASFLAVVFSVVQRHPAPPKHALEAPFGWTVLHLLHWLLKEIVPSGAHADTLCDTIRLTDSPEWVVELLRVEGDDAQRQRHPDRFVLDVADLDRVRSAVAAKANEMAAGGKLLPHPALRALVNAWVLWGDSTGATAWAVETAQSIPGAVALISAFAVLAESYETTGLPTGSEWRVDVEALGKLCDLGVLRTVVQDVELSSLSERDREAVRVFRGS